MKTLTEDKIKSMSKDQIDTYLNKIDNAINHYSQEHKKIFSMVFSSSEDSSSETDGELISNSNNMEVEKKVKKVIKKKSVPVEVMSEPEVEMKPEAMEKKKVVRKKVVKEVEEAKEMPEKEEKSAPAKAKKEPSAWVKHALEHAKKMGISYKEALMHPEVKKKYKK